MAAATAASRLLATEAGVGAAGVAAALGAEKEAGVGAWVGCVLESKKEEG